MNKTLFLILALLFGCNSLFSSNNKKKDTISIKITSSQPTDLETHLTNSFKYKLKIIVYEFRIEGDSGTSKFTYINKELYFGETGIIPRKDDEMKIVLVQTKWRWFYRYTKPYEIYNYLTFHDSSKRKPNLESYKIETNRKKNVNLKESSYVIYKGLIYKFVVLDHRPPNIEFLGYPPRGLPIEKKK